MIGIKTCSTRIIAVQSRYCQVRFTPGSQFSVHFELLSSLSRSFNLEMSSRKGFDMAADRGRKREGKSGKKKEKKREKEIGFEERPVPPCLLHPVDLETSWQTEEEVATASFEIRGRDCAMLRNTMTSERPLSDTLPHPRGSSLSRRIHEEEEDEERGGIRQKEMENREKSGKEETKKIVQTNVWSLLHSLSCLSAFYFLSLSLFPPSLLSSSSSSLSLPDLFVSFAGKNVGLSDGWIYFRTRLSTSPTRDLCENRGPWQTFKRGGDYSYLAVARWEINDGGCASFSVKRVAGVRLAKKKIYFSLLPCFFPLFDFAIRGAK